MNYNVYSLSPFDKQLKKLVKKYPSLKNEITLLASQLSLNPKMGIDIGNNFFKIRISIASKGRGKSSGARVITNFLINENSIYLISIYDKSKIENITEKEIRELLKFVP